MGKSGGIMTAKAIGNRIKAKGLNKLKFYCGACQKSCRDANGFKSHCNSESHVANMRVFRASGGSMLDQFSQDFEKTFMDVLKRSGRKRTRVTKIYTEVIADRHHTHLNSTCWSSLTNFAMYLGKQGKAEVDEQDGRFYIKYVDRDPEKQRRQEQVRAREKQEMDLEDRNERALREQMNHALEQRIAAGLTDDPARPAKEFQKKEGEAIQFSAGTSSKLLDAHTKVLQPQATVFMDLPPPPSSSSSSAAAATAVSSIGNKTHKRKSALDEIIEMEERKKKQKQEQEKEHQAARQAMECKKDEKEEEEDPWVIPGVVVKVLSKVNKKQFYKQKASVTATEDYVATLCMKGKNNGTVLKVDEKQLETVLPALGKRVMILRGPHRGKTAILDSIQTKTFSANVRLDGKVLPSLPYEHISKVM